MGFCAQIRGHARQDHLINAALAQLQGQIVGVVSINLVRRRHDGFSVFDVLLVLRHPIRAGSFETIDVQRSCAVKHSNLVHEFFQCTLKFPTMIRWIVIMR